MNECLLDTLFTSGNKLLVEFVNDKNALKSLQTTVEDLEGEYLVLNTPVVNNAPVSFRESQELTLLRLEKQNQQAYVTNVVVIDICQGENELLVCSKPVKIEKTSLRRFARFDVDLPFRYKTKDNEIERSGRIKDLSLSGCYALINPDSQVEKGTLLEFIVAIPGKGSELVLNGNVTRTDNPAKGEQYLTGLAIDYQDLLDDDRETLYYYYIFQLQLTGDSAPATDL